MKEFRNTLSGYSSTEWLIVRSRSSKERTRICEIKRTFVPSIFTLSSKRGRHFNVSFRRRWSQRNFSENRNIQSNQSKDILSKIRGLRRNIVLASRRCRWRPRLLFSGRPTVPFININTDLMSTKIYVLFCAYESIGVLKALILVTENELIKTKI